MSGRKEYVAEPADAVGTGRATIVIGRLRQTPRPPVDAPVTRDAPAAVAAAFAAVPNDLERLAAELRGQGLDETAQIVSASVLIAQDAQLRELVDREVADGIAPQQAMTNATEHFARLLAELDDPVLAARSADVRAVGHRLAAALTGSGPSTVEASGPLVLAGWEVTADDLLLNAGSVAGAASVIGAETAHVGIVARSLGIPILFGVEPDLLAVPDGTEVLLDVGLGRVVVEPDDAYRARAEADAAALNARRAQLAASRATALSTSDGRSIVVLANVASAAEAELAVRMDAPGIGLLRTEMPFLGAHQWPTYEQHLAELTAVLRPLAGRPVTVRTLDFADDKLPPFLRAGRSGPLGPGLALLLAEPEAFGAQLRAIIEAGRRCDVRVSIMIPMVDSVAALERCRALVATAAAAVESPPPPVGAMVELRESISVVGELAAVTDFFSIGTNDLTASILGLGRRDPSLTPARIREPAVLDAIARTVRAGNTHQRSVSVCGDAASDPKLVPDLLDLGCRVLSVAPSMMDEVRAAARAHLG